MLDLGKMIAISSLLTAVGSLLTGIASIIKALKKDREDDNESKSK